MNFNINSTFWPLIYIFRNSKLAIWSKNWEFFQHGFGSGPNSLYTFYWLHSNQREYWELACKSAWLGLFSDSSQLTKKVIYKTHRKNEFKYKGHIQFPHNHNFLLCLQKLFKSLCLSTLCTLGENPWTLWIYISVQPCQFLVISALVGWNVASVLSC